ncbi:hypothetical protein BDC45DRAFT_129100 [Circinella umbellata]|nr:hypothetical protein BDC45DRAFT_129100 [Circinella umbellata]
MNIIQGTPECLVENEFLEETPLERNKTYLDLEDDNSSNSNKRIRTRERRPVVIPASLDDSLPYNQFESDSEPEKELSQESDYDFVRNNDIQVDNTLLSASIDDDSSNMDESEFEEYDTTDDTLVVKESYPVKKIVGVRTRSQTKKHQLLMMNRDNVGTEVGRKPFSEQGENIQRNIPSKRKHYDSALDDENEQIIGKPPKGRVYYCPYQKCNYNCSDHISSLFKHFRNQHDSTFPKMYRTDIFMSPLGKNIDFTANSKNLLKKGDRIRLLFHNDCDEALLLSLSRM